MRRVKAKRQMIAPRFFAMAEIDPRKVAALMRHLQAGGKVPPVVVAMYDDRAMPLDGHHRLSAHRALDQAIDAWVIEGREFDRLCIENARDAECYVMCDGVPAMEVAGKWKGVQQ